MVSKTTVNADGKKTRQGVGAIYQLEGHAGVKRTVRSDGVAPFWKDGVVVGGVSFQLGVHICVVWSIIDNR